MRIDALTFSLTIRRSRYQISYKEFIEKYFMIFVYCIDSTNYIYKKRVYAYIF